MNWNPRSLNFTFLVGTHVYTLPRIFAQFECLYWIQRPRNLRRHVFDLLCIQPISQKTASENSFWSSKSAVSQKDRPTERAHYLWEAVITINAHSCEGRPKSQPIHVKLAVVNCSRETTREKSDWLDPTHDPKELNFKRGKDSTNCRFLSQNVKVSTDVMTWVNKKERYKVCSQIMRTWKFSRQALQKAIWLSDLTEP